MTMNACWVRTTAKLLDPSGCAGTPQVRSAVNVNFVVPSKLSCLLETVRTPSALSDLNPTSKVNAKILMNANFLQHVNGINVVSTPLAPIAASTLSTVGVVTL
uniref:Uncharacterized protein n=1 Tax=Timema poppense TaxID=170557 RepID=A0A7R9DW23_TIMPO|nr:unnamed protein product [Timema poppensis]